jgi:hypothetical protein
MKNVGTPAKIRDRHFLNVLLVLNFSRTMQNWRIEAVAVSSEGHDPTESSYRMVAKRDTYWVAGVKWCAKFERVTACMEIVTGSHAPLMSVFVHTIGKLSDLVMYCRFIIVTLISECVGISYDRRCLLRSSGSIDANEHWTEYELFSDSYKLRTLSPLIFVCCKNLTLYMRERERRGVVVQSV